MTTQNMKLLDLQTGEYLELGKDWGFFGEYIKRIDCEKELYNDINNEKKELTTLLENYFAGKKLSVSEACVIDNLKKGKQSSANANVDRFLQSEVFCVKKQPHTDTLINTICRKTGAVIYGGRYILEQNTIYEYEIIYKITYADSISAQIPRNFEYEQYIYSNVIKYEPRYFINKFICKKEDYLRTIKMFHKIQDDTRIEILQANCRRAVDIFEEYSKQLRNESNKFDELKEHFK